MESVGQVGANTTVNLETAVMVITVAYLVTSFLLARLVRRLSVSEQPSSSASSSDTIVNSLLEIDSTSLENRFLEYGGGWHLQSI